MKTTTLKRTLAGVFAAAMLCSSVSCASGGSSSDSNGNSSSGNSPSASNVSDKTITNVYRSTDIDADIPMDYVNSIKQIGGGNILIEGNDDKGNSILLITDSEFSTFTPLDLKLELSENSTSFVQSCVLGNGNIAAIVQITDYGDFQLPDWEDPTFNYDEFDFDAMNEAAEYSCKFLVLSPDGEILASSDLADLDQYKGEEGEPLQTGNICAIGEDKCLLSIYNNDKDIYVILDSDGKFVEEVDITEGMYQGTCLDENKNLVYLSWGSNNLELKKISAEDYKPMSDTLSLSDLESNGMSLLMPGNGDYSYYFSGGNALYGIKADGSSDEVVNWIDSDINGNYISAILPVEGGDFIIYERNWESDTRSLYRITKRDASELADSEVLTLAVMYADSSVTSKVTAFNKQSDNIRIKIKDYSTYYEYDEQAEKSINTPAKQLKMDIVSGNVPDMLCCYDLDVMNTLASKGTFTDLSQVMTGSVSADNIMPNIIDALSLDGKLYYMTPSFSISTLAIKSKYFDKENWTFDDLIATYEKMPADTMLFRDGNSKSNVFYTLYYNMDFVDAANGTCSFDSPEFIKLLEFADKFPAEDDHPDWENASQEEMDAFYRDQQLACRNDKALLNMIYFSEARDYARAAQGDFGDDITLVGYPSDNGQGAKLNINNCFAIMEESSNKAACWEFISTFFDYSDNSMNYGSFPVLISEFDKFIDRSMDRPYWTNEKGEKQYYDDSYWLGNDEQIDIKPLTQEERDYVANYIKNTTGRSAYYNEDIYSIVNEETEPFFNGERSAQETAELIQNRASIIISEQS